MKYRNNKMKYKSDIEETQRQLSSWLSASGINRDVFLSACKRREFQIKSDMIMGRKSIQLGFDEGDGFEPFGEKLISPNVSSNANFIVEALLLLMHMAATLDDEYKNTVLLSDKKADYFLPIVKQFARENYK